MRLEWAPPGEKAGRNQCITVRRALSSIIDSFDVEALTISASSSTLLVGGLQGKLLDRVAENETTSGFSPAAVHVSM